MTVLLVLALAQDPDAKAVDQAIDRAAEYLLKNLEAKPANPCFASDELMLLALVHAGKKAATLLDRMLKAPMDGAAYPVYNVSLRAMVLAKLDPKKYQVEIARCAWWLVNSQTDNGQWDYYGPAGAPPNKFDATHWKGKSAKGKTIEAVGVKVDRVEKWGAIPPKGTAGKIYRNTSTAQYAILGLYAAHQAQVAIPEETWKRALDAILTSRGPDGGWGYIDKADKNNAWQPSSHPYPYMTASNLAALAVLQEMLGKKLDDAMSKGFAYLEREMKLVRAEACPNASSSPLTFVYFYYGLFSIERSYILWGRKGDWYAHGAKDLLATQDKDGSWGADTKEGTDRLVCTSFAILFLRRAVQPAVIYTEK